MLGRSPYSSLQRVLTTIRVPYRHVRTFGTQWTKHKKIRKIKLSPIHQPDRSARNHVVVTDSDTAIRAYYGQPRPVPLSYALDVIKSLKLTRNTSSGERRQAAKIVQRITDDFNNGELEYNLLLIDKLFLQLRALGQYDQAKEMWTKIKLSGQDHILGLYYPVLLMFADKKAHMELAWLEEMYEEALSHPDAGPFMAYHAVPNAILQDRNGTRTLTGISSQVPLIMVAIARARMIHGSWRDAYLVLDSAVRLSNKFPKFFCEAMLDIDMNTPASESYRLALLSSQEGNAITPYKIDILLGELMKWQRKATYGLSTDDQLAEGIKPLISSLNLITTHLDAGGQIEDGYLNKILLMLIRLVLPETLLYKPKNPEWIRYAHAVAECGFKLVDDLMPLIQKTSLSPYRILLDLSVHARHKQLFQTTLGKYFGQGGSPSEVAPVLVKGAGSFGTPDSVKAAWQELKATRAQDDSPLSSDDYTALAQAVRSHHTTEIKDFFRSELPVQEDATKLMTLVNKAIGAHKSRDSPLDLEKARTVISDLFSEAAKRINTTKQKVTEGPMLDYQTISMSLRLQPLASEQDLYEVYDELSVDSSVRSSPEYKPVPYESLGEYRQLQRRFRNWVAITELMAEAQQSTQFQKENPNATSVERTGHSFKAIRPMNSLFLGDPYDSLTQQQPRFTNSKDLGSYIRQLRQIESPPQSS
jgi:hypothetical protein